MTNTYRVIPQNPEFTAIQVIRGIHAIARIAAKFTAHPPAAIAGRIDGEILPTLARWIASNVQADELLRIAAGGLPPIQRLLLKTALQSPLATRKLISAVESVYNELLSTPASPRLRRLAGGASCADHGSTGSEGHVGITNKNASLRKVTR